MATPMNTQFDLIKELRLRRWARENYVSVEERSDSWHRIVLDEMRRKETDLAEQHRNRVRQSAYVPLAPTPVHLIDAGHVGPGNPKVLYQDEYVDKFISG